MVRALSSLRRPLDRPRASLVAGASSPRVIGGGAGSAGSTATGRKRRSARRGRRRSGLGRCSRRRHGRSGRNGRRSGGAGGVPPRSTAARPTARAAIRDRLPPTPGRRETESWRSPRPSKRHPRCPAMPNVAKGKTLNFSMSGRACALYLPAGYVSGTEIPLHGRAGRPGLFWRHPHAPSTT